MFVCVDGSRRFENPYGLDLKGILRKWSIPLVRRMKDGSLYPSQVAIPSPSFLVRLLRLKPDAIIVIEFTPIAILGTIAAKVIGRAKLVLLVESDPASRGGSRNPLVLAIKRWVARRADVIQTNNEAGARYLTGTLRACPEKVHVAPYLTSRPPGPQPPVDPVADRRIRLLFANSLTERKGLRHVFIALSQLPGEILQRVELTVVGDGPERQSLEQLARKLGIGGAVWFAGARRYCELGPFYANADVLVAPSLADYRSLASFEGLNYGLALLVSERDGAARETVISGETGFTFTPEDHAQIIGLITRLVTDRALLAKCRKGSLFLGKTRYCVNTAAHNIADSLARVLAEG